nr:MAG TPA: hypothetical protein [Caudoviricetes sp.]
MYFNALFRAELRIKSMSTAWLLITISIIKHQKYYPNYPKKLLYHNKDNKYI